MEDATIRVKTKVDNADLSKFGSNFIAQGKQWGSIIGNVSSALGKMALKLGVVGLLVKGISALVNMTKEGFKNLAQTGGEYNKVMSDFKSQTEQLKNALASAFEPIVVMIIPYLTKLCEWLTTAADYTAQFLAVISGKTSYQRAKKQTVDYASTLKKTTSEAKKALATFDQLNVLTSGSGSSGSSAGGAATGADAYETVNLEGWEGVTSTLEKIDELIYNFSEGFKNGLRDLDQAIYDTSEKVKQFKDEAIEPSISILEEGFTQASLTATGGFIELCLAGDSFVRGDYTSAIEHMTNALELQGAAWDTLAVHYVASFALMLAKMEEIFGIPIPSWVKEMLGLSGSGGYHTSSSGAVHGGGGSSKSTYYSSYVPDSVYYATQRGSAYANSVAQATGQDSNITLTLNLDGDVVYSNVVEKLTAQNKAKGM